MTTEQQSGEALRAQIDAWIEDIAPACVDCSDRIVEARRGAMERLAKRFIELRPTPQPDTHAEGLVERIVVEFSDKAVLGLDVREDDVRLECICDEMRIFVRAALASLPTRSLGYDDAREDAAKVAEEWEPEDIDPRDYHIDEAGPFIAAAIRALPNRGEGGEQT
jgi:hypothetical protein